MSPNRETAKCISGTIFDLTDLYCLTSASIVAKANECTRNGKEKHSVCFSVFDVPADVFAQREKERESEIRCFDISFG